MQRNSELSEILAPGSLNKYVLRAENGEVFGFAVQQARKRRGLISKAKGGPGFDIHFFDVAKSAELIAQCTFDGSRPKLDLYLPSGALIGSVKDRSSLFRRKFDVLSPMGTLMLSVVGRARAKREFHFGHRGEVWAVMKCSPKSTEKGAVQKDEPFFDLAFVSQRLPDDYRGIVLAVAVFLDARYF